MAEDRFLRRWSRLKRGAETEAKPKAPLVSSDPGAAEPPDLTVPEEPQFDPATLPPLESLGADSDYTMFLKKGVPAALRQAALRRAWSSDPVIRDFRTPADYDWDFTKPEFDMPLDAATREKLLAGIFGPPRTAEVAAMAGADAAPPDAPLPPAGTEQPPPSAVESAAAAAEPEPVADPPYEPAPPRRRRGGALPV